MSTENQQPEQNEIIDLGFDVDQVDLSRPTLKAGRYKFSVNSTVQKPTQKDNPDGTKKNLVIAFRLEQPAEATKRDAEGKVVTISPGFTITENWPMWDSPKMSKDQWKERPARLHSALGLTGGVNTGAWQGRSFLAEVVIRPARKDEATGETYPESNSIKRVYPLSDQDQTAAGTPVA